MILGKDHVNGGKAHVIGGENLGNRGPESCDSS